jgi:SOS response regulatory protein OraA/RecX
MALEKSQNQQLADHIKRNLSKGYTIESLKYSLMQQGYSRTSIEKALQIANKQLAETAPKMVEKPVIKYQTIDDEEMAAKVAAQSEGGFFKRMFGWFKKSN